MPAPALALHSLLSLPQVVPQRSARQCFAILGACQPGGVSWFAVGQQYLAATGCASTWQHDAGTDVPGYHLCGQHVCVFGIPDDGTQQHACSLVAGDDVAGAAWLPVLDGR